MWNNTEVSKLLKIKYPVIQAPMAGGPTTPELVSAVSNGGGLGTFGAGYSTPEDLDRILKKIRSLTDFQFGVNLFVPGQYEVDQERIKQISEIMRPYRKELGISEKAEYEPIEENYNEQVAVLIRHKVPVISFTFGVPGKDSVRELKRSGAVIIGTCTTVDEAVDLEQNGIDIVVAQGFESGGHRGSYMKTPEKSLIGTMSLVPQVSDNVGLPVVAAGGIMDGRGIAAAICLGAAGVQMGTAFLTCKESGAHEIHKQAIFNSKEDDTVLTKMFSGKLARGLCNKFTSGMEGYGSVVPDYPVQNSLTRDIRRASAKKGETDFMSLWSGQGVRLSRSLEAGQLLKQLVEQTDFIFNNVMNPD